MSIVRITYGLPRFALFVQICAALIYTPRPAVALHYDAQAQQNLGIDKSRIDTSNIISGFGSPYATLGGTAGLYFLGLGTHMSALPKQGVWERRRSSIL